MSERIPIENLCYMLSYAWDLPARKVLQQAGFDDYYTPVDWFAELLQKEIAYIFRRGLQMEYASDENDLKVVRGRIELISTAKMMYLKQGKVRCRFDELSTHTPTNIILKSTLSYLLRSESMSEVGRKIARDFYIRLGDIPVIEPLDAVSLPIRYSRSNEYYRFAMSLCKLILSQIAIHKTGSTTVFVDYNRDHNALASLFERFVRNYYTRHLHDARVGAPIIQWNFEPFDTPSRAILPNMRTDLIIERLSR
jgi:5-methylcytosine-specific restriction enzyme subunit McrC